MLKRTSTQAEPVPSTLKVLYVITRSEPGGAQVHLLDLLTAFHRPFRLSLAVGEDGYLVRKARELGVGIHLLPNLVQPLSPRKDCQALIELVRLIRRLKPDLVHAHSSKAGLLARLAAKLAGVPSIFTAHGWAFADGVPRAQRLFALPGERVAAWCCRKIIVVSQADYALGMTQRIARKAKMVVIHNGIADRPSRACPRGNPGQLVRIVSVARFAPQKDQSTLLRAAAGLPPHCHLAFIGDGPTRTRVEHEAKALSMSGRVEFLGERNDVEEILAGAQIFALTSHWEGFPISILEAMRAGLPVLASDVGGVAEAVAHGETGFVVPRADVATAAERLGRLVASPELRAQMGAAGRRRFEQLFSLQGMLTRTLESYRDALGADRICPSELNPANHCAGSE
jgi:glycosyltransferase involved in cell wall biosynthesis